MGDVAVHVTSLDSAGHNSGFVADQENSTRSRDSLLVERRTRDRKVASSNPGRSGGRIFLSRVNLHADSYSVSLSTPRLPQWHVKNPVILPKVQVSGYT